LLLLSQGSNYFITVGNFFFEALLFSDKLGVGHGLEVFVSERAAAWQGSPRFYMLCFLPVRRASSMPHKLHSEKLFQVSVTVLAAVRL
jgi:hypothetical protein